MPLRGDLRKDRASFTGFVVTYQDGSTIYEKENYFSKKLNKKCATNWAEIDKSKIETLALYWEGDLKIKIERSPSEIHKNTLLANDWFFSHRGYLDMGTQKVVILSRNIGYVENNITHVFSIIENTGELNLSIRTH